MLYLVRVEGGPWVKLGWTTQSIWRRLGHGLHGNQHPPELCNRLEWSNLTLLGLWQGGRAEELQLQSALPPHTGEFWPLEQADALMEELGKLVAIPLPPRPEQPPVSIHDLPADRPPCCTGSAGFRCFMCDKTFAKFHHLKQHRQSHSGVKVACACGTEVLKRNLKRHKDSGSCRASGASSSSQLAP